MPYSTRVSLSHSVYPICPQLSPAERIRFGQDGNGGPCSVSPYKRVDGPTGMSAVERGGNTAPHEHAIRADPEGFERVRTRKNELEVFGQRHCTNVFRKL